MDILNKFSNNIPNILFHGNIYQTSIFFDFIKKIYKYDDEQYHNNLKIIYCAFDKIGIQYIRDELKNFLKIKVNNKVEFKTVFFVNADNLTTDAQSSLRRCIEIYNYNTLFIMTVEHKTNLLQPILSRFYSIYIPFDNNKLSIEFDKSSLIQEDINQNLDLITLSQILYNKGYCGLDLLCLLDIDDKMDSIILKKNVRDEKTFIFIILNKLKNK